ncbi:MFS transporter, DHA2 family, multidrug resistance protein [Amycolatopsis xylanica]|uniref:MFS transporter, DHA2 family, multidrug resistance protein n=1 Tax=Amycolatopsis xylanica TaxID=589385 RepID=A0A1H3RDI2_9PSEU|nr:MFS transporter [Amycolatopsis xylanica]SDZ23311.1 MFS transporter, DHA2 family, multidrug resistance protein [Amycolatopsis xylanica]
MNLSAPQRAGRREWIGLLALTLPTLLVTMDMTVLQLAVPNLSTALKPSGSQLLWITDIYGFVIAGFLVPMGTLGDRIGRRRLLLIGAAGFAVASALAAFAPSAELLIVARVLLGVAGATLMPSTMALIRNMFLDEAQRMRAIGMWMTSFMVGAAIGPVVGGALLSAFWWGSAFLLNVPVMVLLLVVAPFLLPEYRETSAPKMDWFSAFLSLVAVLAVIYGMTHIATEGVSWPAFAAIAAGLVVGYVFVRRQRTLAEPLLDLNLFAGAKFSVALGTLTFNTFVMMGFNLFVAQYLQMVVGLDPLAAGLWTLPATVAGMAVLFFLPMLVGGVRPAYVMAGGLVFASVGFVLFTTVAVDGGLSMLVISSIIMFAGLSSVGVVGTNMVISAAPPERAGAASAIQTTGNELGGALGLAVLGSIGIAVYQGKMSTTTPAGLPDAVAEQAREQIGGAVAAAPRFGDELLAAARAAFTAGMHVTAIVCAAIVLVLAALVLLLLRNVGAPLGARTETTDEEVTADPTADRVG